MVATRRSREPSEKAKVAAAIAAAAAVTIPKAKRPRGRPRKNPLPQVVDDDKQPPPAYVETSVELPALKASQAKKLTARQVDNTKPYLKPALKTQKSGQKIPKTAKVVVPKTAKAIAPKNTKAIVPFKLMCDKELEEMRKKFYEEPTQDDLSRVLEEGLADGTIIIDEDDLDYEYPEEPDSFRFNLYGASTSTPFHHRPTATISEIEDSDEGETKDFKPDEEDTDDDNVSAELAVKVKRMTKKKAPQKPKAATKGKGKASAKGEEEEEEEEEVEIQLTRLTVGSLALSVFVDDGVGSHCLDISTRDDYSILLGKVASKMALPIHCIMLGYESPWSSKVGQKRRPIYIVSEFNLDFFWSTSKQHIEGKEGGKKSRSQVIAELGASITFVNMMEAAKPALKQGGRSSNAQVAKYTKAEAMGIDAKASAQAKQLDAGAKISAAFACASHSGRLCYPSIKGGCSVYTPTMVTEHTALLARGEPGVVADKIPLIISSKLLDYKREGRGGRAASASSPPEEPEVVPEQAPAQRMQTPAAPEPDIATRRAPLDFPALTPWLRSCEDHIVRGRDRHNYTVLEGVFTGNGFTRIDDVIMLSPEGIMDLAKREGLNVPLALVHRVFKYAKEDVEFVQAGGKLP